MLISIWLLFLIFSINVISGDSKNALFVVMFLQLKEII